MIEILICISSSIFNICCQENIIRMSIHHSANFIIHQLKLSILKLKKIMIFHLYLRNVKIYCCNGRVCNVYELCVFDEGTIKFLRKIKRLRKKNFRMKNYGIME